MSRDLPAERKLLAEAGVPPGFAEAVTARLDEKDEVYGSSFAWRSCAAAWDELAGQAVDLAARAVLAHRRAELDGIPERQLSRLRALLATVAGCGAQADVLIGEARRIVAATERGSA